MSGAELIVSEPAPTQEPTEIPTAVPTADAQDVVQQLSDQIDGLSPTVMIGIGALALLLLGIVIGRRHRR